jgi:hypothetical protein
VKRSGISNNRILGEWHMQRGIAATWRCLVGGVTGAGIALGGATLQARADDESLRALCPDRPGKGTSPCTVDAGYWQVEIDAFDATLQRHDAATQDSYVAFAPTIKYGVTDTLDVELGLAPLNWTYANDGKKAQTDEGFGDLYLRTKWNFLGDAAGALSAVVEPYVKLPTASKGFGDGAVENGVVVPLSYDLGNNWSLSSTPEIDLLRNAHGDGRHANLVDVAGIGKSLDGGITLGAEVWADWNEDPNSGGTQTSFDLDAAWQPACDSNLQIDGGADFGLNARTPDLEIYTGISRRF